MSENSKFNRYGFLIGLIASAILGISLLILASAPGDYSDETKWAISGLICSFALIIISLKNILSSNKSIDEPTKFKIIPSIIVGIVLCMIILVLISIFMVFMFGDGSYEIYIIQNEKIGIISFPICVFISWLFAKCNHHHKIDNV